MKIRLAHIILVAFLLLTLKAQAQNISNEGTDFWAVFPTHVPSGTSLANMTIFISSKQNSSGNVIAGGIAFPFTVQANTVASVVIPRNLAYIDDFDANKVLRNKGIHVVVDAGKPKVAVYAHIYARARSEAYLVLPLESLGKKYFGMVAPGLSAPAQIKGSMNGKPYLVVVATEDNTNIIIKRNNALNAEKVSLPFKGDVYEILEDENLTGTSIEIDDATSSCKTIAVYSGHSGIAMGGNSYDPLLQQLYPTASWGRVYGVVPFLNRNHFYQVVASEDNTEIKINGAVMATLNTGQVYESDYMSNFELVSANKPISVAQFTVSQDAISATSTAQLGDPDMVILNPVEYSIKNITVFSSNLEAIQSKYINIFMKTATRGSFLVNGQPPTGNWVTTTSDPNYSYLQLEVFNQSLTLSANDGFNAIAYGFGDHESYAYSAGTNLASSLFLLLQNKVTNKETIAACLGQASDFKLTMPYMLSKIVWKDASGSVILIDNQPVGTQKIVNGQTLYTYLSPVNQTFNTVGTLKFSATVTIPQSTGTCFSGDLDLNFDLDVDPLPVSNFDVNATGCADEEIAFTDKSNSRVVNKQLNTWLWDFGDGETSTEQNPKHIFASSGTFTVKLMAGAENGCLSDVFSKTIVIKPKVTANFQSNYQTSCIQTPITFTDQSTVGSGGRIVKWIWDMGDGKPPLQKLNASAFTYIYDAMGEYTVSLTAQSDAGCTSLPYTKKITITALPTVNFAVPAFCLADARASFINSATDTDGSTAQLTYLWNYGDPASGMQNTSTGRDGSHRYNSVGNYNVTLTVFNANGCSVTLTQPFTVNGSFPKAIFEPINGPNFCSNQSFEVINKSTVDFGKVTKIEWFIDGIKYSEDTAPLPNKVYQFSYPAFFNQATKTVMLKMVAYSGSSCSDETSMPITLLASPQVVFNALSPLCLNNGSVQLIATELGGLNGTGIYSGDGVNANGIFDPAIAGVGVHQITYTFTATNGCSDSKIQNIEVYPLPEASAGPDLFVLAGGEKQFSATASGRGLTYKWAPAIGLDRDDILNPTVKLDKDMTYTLTVTSSDGCSVVDQVNVKILNDFKPPNSFSPNGDGINDTWNIKYLDSYPKVTVEIFNRNGQRIYYSKGYSVPFNGNYDNQLLPVGTYYYIISPNNGAKTISGNLTIIR